MYIPQLGHGQMLGGRCMTFGRLAFDNAILCLSVHLVGRHFSLITKLGRFSSSQLATLESSP